jgi:hypothetical protein
MINIGFRASDEFGELTIQSSLPIAMPGDELANSVTYPLFARAGKAYEANTQFHWRDSVRNA